MRAQPDGGSVAVLQEDGKTRAVLVYGSKEGQTAEGKPLSPSSNLIFADDSGNTLLKLRADDVGGMMTAGIPGQPDAIALVAKAP